MHYLDYIEHITHGTAEFPMALYHVDEAHPRYEMPFHWHREMEIIRIARGSFSCYLNDERIPAKKGDMLFIAPGILHGGMPDACVYDCVVFDHQALLLQADICRKHMRVLTAKNIRIPSFFSADTQPLAEITDRLISAMEKGTPGSQLTALGALWEWFGYILESHSFVETDEEGAPDSKKIQSLKPVLEYIDRCYMQPVTLEELARLAGMSPRYFCRFFYALTHRTPIEYLNYYRIERACYLLCSSHLSVTEAAYRCGFNDSSYFVKIFRKCKGITPGQYRKQFR